MDFCDLAVEVSRHEALPGQFHKFHLDLDAAPEVSPLHRRQIAGPRFCEARTASLRATASVGAVLALTRGQSAVSSVRLAMWGAARVATTGQPGFGSDNRAEVS